MRVVGGSGLRIQGGTDGAYWLLNGREPDEEPEPRGVVPLTHQSPDINLTCMRIANPLDVG